MAGVPNEVPIFSFGATFILMFFYFLKDDKNKDKTTRSCQAPKFKTKENRQTDGHGKLNSLDSQWQTKRNQMPSYRYRRTDGPSVL